jgi:outer membrane protein OmpA-like peptidoglycan-associated protein
MDLLPYHTYRLNIDPNTFQDPLHNTEYKSYAITADPNQFKSVYIPVFVAGSAEGTVTRETTFGEVPQSSVRLLFEHKKTNHVYETATFSDGSFFLFGLRPGEYRVTIDSAQTNRLSIRCEPEHIDFELDALPEGDARTGLSFILKPPHKMADLAPADALRVEPPAARLVLGDQEEAKAEIAPEVPSVVPDEKPPEPVPLNQVTTMLVDLDRRTLSEHDRAYLDRLAAMLLKNDKLVAVIQGHSDNFGTFIQSQRRSEQRAEFIKHYLLDKGVQETSVFTRGLGSRRPAVRNTSNDSRRKNNRVEIQLISLENPKDERHMMSVRGMDQ